MSEGSGSCGIIRGNFLNKYKPLIRVFSKCPVASQEVLLKHPDLGFIKLLCEVSLNVLYKTIPLSESCLKELRKYKKLLFYFSDKNISLKKKVKFVKNKKGGYRKFVTKLFKCIEPYL